MDTGVEPLPVPLNVVPSDNVPENAPLAVTSSVRFVAPPLQIVLFPLNTAIGLGFTIIFILSAAEHPDLSVVVALYLSVPVVSDVAIALGIVRLLSPG